MDRRKSLKLLAGTVATGAFIESCQTGKNKEAASTNGEPVFTIDRAKEELERDTKLMAEKFFNAHEMATIAILADIIIPKDEVSGSATEAGVPDFIEFIVKDMPQHQVPMRGGLRWLDMQCLKRFEKAFKDCEEKQRLEIIDAIAWPNKAVPAMKQGVHFFNLMRNLTASGFYSSAIGIKDVGYVGNSPNQWNGVPEDVLQQYNLAYTEKELKECISFDKTG
ncbi:MAG TPA: gluconate 2-dehydrogenase subunit 3 family protein [Ferruginibacter sp.]|nr:gluconate 2-dehydrogenase subunit 3 family protein [Ferruginibacter sp.]HMP19846.1 gluconate 2-dehydrogenase subunit 3 family protein [Ferruginibacter sp.]